jgi:type IV secretion system protein VirB9
VKKLCMVWLMAAMACPVAVAQKAGQKMEPKTPTPNVSTEDRLLTLPYQENQVVKIWGRFGYTTSVVFGAEEKIRSVAIGYPEAWEVTQLVNRLVIKPRSRNGQTNLTVVTDLHTYYFELDIAQGKNLGEVRHAIRFSYAPAAEDLSRQLGLLQQIAAQQAVITRLEQGLQERGANRNYTFQGSADVAPFEAWDDGRFTYLRFADNQDMPAIYAVDKQGNESLVNFTIEGNLTIVRSIGRQFRLRRGSDVVCIFNEAELRYEFQLERSGTVSDDVKRVTH